MLDLIENTFIKCDDIQSERVSELNIASKADGDVFYVMEREHRIKDNWSFIFADNLSKKLNKNLFVMIFLDKRNYSQNQYDFMLKGIEEVKKELEILKIQYKIVGDDLLAHLKDAGAVIFDFNPITPKEEIAKKLKSKVYEVDSHNIVPARFVSDKQEFSAATLRRKIYANIGEFLIEFNNPYPTVPNEAEKILKEFIEDGLNRYVAEKNDPNKNATSNLSPHLHFGHISSQRIAIEVIKSKVSKENKEAFLEELIVRKELADNFCLYNKNYRKIDCAHSWARETLKAHESDLRLYSYNQSEFEEAKTHDEFWNAMQRRLVKTGKMHGYLRMYWAKKILEWSKSPQEALDIAIYLNDKYALDGNDTNGYVGILWSIAGVHDRAFQERQTTGKIRCMTLGGCKKKFDVAKFIKNNP